MISNPSTGASDKNARIAVDPWIAGQGTRVTLTVVASKDDSMRGARQLQILSPDGEVFFATTLRRRRGRIFLHLPEDALPGFYRARVVQDGFTLLEQDFEVVQADEALHGRLLALAVRASANAVSLARAGSHFSAILRHLRASSKFRRIGEVEMVAQSGRHLVQAFQERGMLATAGAITNTVAGAGRRAADGMSGPMLSGNVTQGSPEAPSSPLGLRLRDRLLARVLPVLQRAVEGSPGSVSIEAPGTDDPEERAQSLLYGRWARADAEGSGVPELVGALAEALSDIGSLLSGTYPQSAASELLTSIYYQAWHRLRGPCFCEAFDEAIVSLLRDSPLSALERQCGVQLLAVMSEVQPEGARATIAARLQDALQSEVSLEICSRLLLTLSSLAPTSGEWLEPIVRSLRVPERSLFSIKVLAEVDPGLAAIALPDLLETHISHPSTLDAPCTLRAMSEAGLDRIEAAHVSTALERWVEFGADFETRLLDLVPKLGMELSQVVTPWVARVLQPVPGAYLVDDVMDPNMTSSASEGAMAVYVSTRQEAVKLGSYADDLQWRLIQAGLMQCRWGAIAALD